MLVGVCDPLIILFAKFVLFGVRIWVAPPPKTLNKVFALLVGGQCLESPFLVPRDDVSDVVAQPFFIDVLHFRPDVARLFVRINIALVGRLRPDGQRPYANGHQCECKVLDNSNF